MARSRSRGARPLTSWSSMKTWPALGASRPAMMRSVVVLPQPEGPTSTSNSPFSTVRSNPRTATWPLGNTLSTCSSRIAGMLSVRLRWAGRPGLTPMQALGVQSTLNPSRTKAMKTYQLPLLMLATGTLLCTTLSCAEAEDKSWVGENVLPTKRAKDIPFSDNVGDKQVNYVFSGQWPIKVRDDRDGRLRIHDGHHEGWVAKTDFVLVADAPAYFDRRIETNPKDAFAWFMHGSGWNEKGEYDKAIKDYDEAIRLDPKFHQAFNNRSVSWRDKKEYDKAIEDCNEAIRLEPKYALAYANRAAAWKLKKDLDQAIKDYDEAIRLDPKFTRYFYSRGDT